MRTEKTFYVNFIKFGEVNGELSIASNEEREFYEAWNSGICADNGMVWKKYGSYGYAAEKCQFFSRNWNLVPTQNPFPPHEYSEKALIQMRLEDI